MPEEDALALKEHFRSLQSATSPADIERLLRALALCWEDYYLPKFPIPFFQVRVADVRATGGSLSTALSLYDEARGLVVLFLAGAEILSFWAPCTCTFSLFSVSCPFVFLFQCRFYMVSMTRMVHHLLNSCPRYGSWRKVMQNNKV